MPSDSKDPDVLLFKAFNLGQLTTFDAYGVKSKSASDDNTFDVLKEVADGKKKLCHDVEDMLRIVPDERREHFRSGLERSQELVAKEQIQIAQHVIAGRNKYFSM